jgi:hypothetical protein
MAAPRTLGACHLSVIALVIETGEMKYTVQHQNAKLIQQRVSELGGLRESALARNREIAETARLAGGKGKNISWVIVTKKIFIEASQFAVIRNDTGE